MIDFSRLPSQSWPGRVARLPLALLPDDLVVRVMQGPLWGAKWVVGSGNHGCWLGSYEFEKQRLFAASVMPGSVVYDVGANVGFYTLIASRLVGPKGTVYSFEPLPRNLEFLRRHLEMNHCCNVEVVPVAVGENEGLRGFDPCDGPSTGHLAAGGSLEATTVSIDSLVERGQIRPPALVKIDIEGAETEMLRGAHKMLERFGPMIFLATHGARNRTECQAILSGLGYSLSLIGSSSLADTDELIAECKIARPLPCDQ